jgi:nucleoside-diphosphate-sugar epimerase
MPDTNKETILVTGSSGFIGRAACNRLGQRFNVVGFDREGAPHPPPVAECVCVDLTSDQSVREGLERVQVGYGERIASVIHLAAYYDFSGEPSEKYETITVQGTERLLRELQKFEVEQFVFSSTMLVHAPCEPDQRINEEWPIEPKWDYPKSKVETEKLISHKHGQIPVVLLRIAGVYDDGGHSIPLAHQIQRIYERRLTGKVFPGDISRGQSFVHLDDLMDALERVVERRKQLAAELTLLIGEPETLSYDELQREFGRLIDDEEWETRQISKTLAKTGAWFQEHVPFGEEPFIKPWMVDLADDHYRLDISRARQALGWEPKHSLRETLPKMAGALKRDPAKFYKENKLDEPPARVEEQERESATKESR